MNDQTPIQTLVEIPSHDAFAVFSTPRVEGQPHPIDKILARVAAEVDAFRKEDVDLSKIGDRKRIASMAYRIAQSKTALEKVGKEIAAEAKEVPKRIDATRRHIADTLDKLRDSVRQPLTDWEIAEDARVTKHGSAITRINSLAAATGLTSAEIKAAIAEVKSFDTRPEATMEFAAEYKIAVDAALPKLADALARAEKHEADQAELARLRADAAEREEADRAERLRKEGEERARLDAENDARVERERVAREAARKEAEHKAQIAALEAQAVAAAAAERAKIEAEKKAEAEAAAARERNRAHKAKVNNAAVQAFVENGADKDTAVLIVKLIAMGKIPAVSITY